MAGFEAGGIRWLVLPDQVAGSGQHPGDSGLQWHISVTRRGERPTATDVLKALRAFGLVGAEEDNHHPGAARHFWLVVDPARRVTCDCKEDEVTVREPDGYTWTNPQPGEGECRGCEMQKLLGKACPIHGASEGATT